MTQIYRPESPIQWGWIALKGPDAADFLHRLTTVHVKALQPGEGTPGFFLNAQGKMRAYFYLWMISREEFFFELDAGSSGKWKQELLSIVEQFHFGEKFVVDAGDAGDRVCAWIFADASDTGFPPAKHLSDLPDGVRLFHHGNQDFGKSWITAWGPQAAVELWTKSLNAKSVGYDEVEMMRISSVRPKIDSELSENTIPLEVGLREAVSDNKGCYPGQEVIERIVSLGAPARRLGKLEGTGVLPLVGDSVTVDGKEVGTVTSVCKTSGGFQALAFVKKIHAKEGLEVTFSSQPASRAKLVVVTPYA